MIIRGRTVLSALAVLTLGGRSLGLLWLAERILLQDRLGPERRAAAAE
jgi:hypothetical protein